MFSIFSEKFKLSHCLTRYFKKMEADALLLPNSIAKYKEIAPHLVRILGDIDVRKINSETIIDLKHELNERRR